MLLTRFQCIFTPSFIKIDPLSANSILFYYEQKTNNLSLKCLYRLILRLESNPQKQTHKLTYHKVYAIYF